MITRRQQYTLLAISRRDPLSIDMHTLMELVGMQFVTTIPSIELTEVGRAAVSDIDPKSRAMSTMLMLRPELITIVGLDTEDGPSHPLFNDRSSIPLDPLLVDDIDQRGVIEPVDVLCHRGFFTCVIGQFRVRAAREVNARRPHTSPSWYPILVECHAMGGGRDDAWTLHDYDRKW